MTSPLESRLYKLFHQHQTPHFLLFHGSSEEEAHRVARAHLLDWLQKSSQNELDLCCIEPQGKLLLHPIEKIRSLLEELSLSPLYGKRRAILIRKIDRMLPSAANALLKTLEEPPPSTVIIATTEKRHLLLPTIRSRAQEVAIGCSAAQRENKSEFQEGIVACVKQAWPVGSIADILALSSALEELIDQEVARHQSGSKKLTDEEKDAVGVSRAYFRHTHLRETLEVLVSYRRDATNAQVSSFAVPLRLISDAFDAIDANVSPKEVCTFFLCSLCSLSS